MILLDINTICINSDIFDGNLVLDPFGNRGNIGLVANWLDRRAIVNDISPKYCRLMRDAGRRRARKNRSWKVLNQDAVNLRGVKSGGVDFILTGPPYYNVEKYEKVPGQASSFRSYSIFLEWYGDVAAELFRLNKPGGFCALKVGNWRARNRMIPFVYDTLKAFQDVGFELHDELICAERPPLGLGFSWDVKWRQKYTHKSHQTVLVFRRPE